MRIRPGLIGIIFATILVLLSGCDNAEQRAEKHFQSAISLLQEGDEARAIIEFKNVFQLNPRHRDARAAYAELQRSRGNIREATGQYLQLVEQYPDDLDGQLALAQIYAESGNWAAVASPMAAIDRLAPGDLRAQALGVVSAYWLATQAQERSRAKLAVTEAEALIPQQADDIMLRQVVIDDLMRDMKYGSALLALDSAIEIAPQNRGLYAARLSVLAALGDDAAIETQLRDMIARFPDDGAPRETLVRWYVSKGRIDDAEAHLRDGVQASGNDVQQQMVLLRFLAELRGQDVAMVELDKILAVGEAPLLLHGLRAGFEFDGGNKADAIAHMQGLLAGRAPSEETRKLTIALARMLLRSGDQDGATTLIDQVLKEDSANVEALKLKSGWLIEGDAVGDAIVALRTALEQAPKDTEIFVLLARAHERDGNLELVGEMLSLAVSTSNYAPEHAVRYSAFLRQRGRLDEAERVLIDALRLAPGNVAVLGALGQVYLARKDWPRAKQVADSLQQLDTVGTAVANDLRIEILRGQGETSDAVAYLEGLVADGDAGFGAHVEIVRNLVINGQPEKAREYVTDLLAQDPQDPEINFLSASFESALGNVAVAETGFRELLVQDPSRVPVWVALYRLLVAGGRNAEAGAVIAQARQALPNDPTVMWITAGQLEADGDVDGAIGIYEKLYARDSDNLIVANNLASLLSNWRTDPASLERASVIARRLRPSKVPPYQDTFGWIAYLRGEIDEAVAFLEPAAIALADDPMVQYHLAQAYMAAENETAALAQFQKVAALVGGGDDRDFVQTTRREISRLSGATE